MSTFAKIALATFLVTLLIVAGAAMTSMYRPTPSPLTASPAPTTSANPTPTATSTEAPNPFSASVVNPFTDEDYTNPFTEKTTQSDEVYVNPFADL